MCVDPSAYLGIRANGDKAWFGWPTSPKVEAAIQPWYDAASHEEAQAATRRLNRAALEDVVYAPTGFFRDYQASRKNVTASSGGRFRSFGGSAKRHEPCYAVRISTGMQVRCQS